MATIPNAPSVSATQYLPLGFGVTRPFKRDKKGDFASASGPALVASALGQILGTVASSEFSQGELPWRPEFGSLLHLLKHRPNNHTLDELARVYVIQAVQRWEPRVRITGVSVGRDSRNEGGDNTFVIKVNYSLVDLATGAVIQEDLDTSIVL